MDILDITLHFYKPEEHLPQSAKRVLIYFPTRSTSVMDALYTREGRFIREGIDFTDAVERWSYVPAELYFRYHC